MYVLNVNQNDSRGGAARICACLHNEYLSRGIESRVLVGKKLTSLAEAWEIDHGKYRNRWAAYWIKQSNNASNYRGKLVGIRWLSKRLIQYLGEPRRLWHYYRGIEYFDYPGTMHILEQFNISFDVLHLHNLHGGFFDLRCLTELSMKIPTVLTMHDTWLLAGHCAYFIDCYKWTEGCKHCEHLDYPPSLKRDGSAINWEHKRNTYANSQITFVCPSKWLADQARHSIVMSGSNQVTVINNGVDLNEFRPGSKESARERLGWPTSVFTVVFAANCIESIWKDYSTIIKAIQCLNEISTDIEIRLYAIGGEESTEIYDNVTVVNIPYRESLVECYQAADVFIHAAKADTFPTTILEALACGKPVVATAVGGIPEQIIEGETGFLTPAGDAPALAERLVLLAKSPELVRKMGEAAHKDAVKRFSLERMVESYIQLYQKLINNNKEDRQ